jgi:hypothetical protein
MKFEVVSQYPFWYFVACLLVGAGYAFILYRKDRILGDANKNIVRILAITRFIFISLVCFLLFAPLLRFIQRTVEKPIIILLQDNSASITASKDSAFYRNQYLQQIEALEKELGSDFEFRKFSFSNRMDTDFSLKFKGKESDIAGALKELNNQFVNRNVGAVILATDGIYNKGISPLYVRNDLKAPIYTVALGDTTIQKDLRVSKVVHNQITYLGNTFPVEVHTNADKLGGTRSTLQLFKGSQLLESREISIAGNAFYQQSNFQLKADAPGVHRYRAVLSTVPGEATTINNSFDFYVEVLDGRQKVLIVADAPHPDVAAIRSALLLTGKYEADVSLVNDFKGSIKGYSLVILHQLPSRTQNVSNIINQSKDENISLWFIVGQNSQLTELNKIQNLVQFNPSRGGNNDVSARFKNDFSLFTQPAEWTEIQNRLDPLQAPNASVNSSNLSAIWMHQKIGSVETNYPLFAFGTAPGQKIAVMCAEGIWRWKLNIFQQKQTHLIFTEFISRIVNFLSIRTEKKNLRVITKNSFAENEPITFEAEVYNASYELINTPDVSLNVYDEKGKKFPFTFSRTAQAYRLDIGMFPAGEYRYEASTNVGGVSYKESGKFMVRAIVAEYAQTTADHSLLNTLATRNNGKMVAPSAINSLVEVIRKNEDIKPLSSSESRLEEPISLVWVFFLLLALISLEWSLRRRFGSY